MFTELPVSTNAETFKESKRTVKYKNLESEEMKESVPESFSDDVITSFSPVYNVIFSTQKSLFTFIHLFTRDLDLLRILEALMDGLLGERAVWPPGGKSFPSEVDRILLPNVPSVCIFGIAC